MSSMSGHDSSVFLPYEKPISTWNTLVESLNVAERDYMKTYLGQSLIERYQEIESEIDSLLEIWRDYRNETIAHCADSSLPKLAEPPALRKRLTSEIEFFVKHIHEQCANNDQIFNRRLSNGHNWNAINYALVTATGDDERRIRERPVSARDRQGRETPALVIPQPAANVDDRPMSPLLSPRSRSSLNIDTKIIREKFENFTIDEIIQQIRDAINEDIHTLEQHVSYLHEKLDEEADYRAKTRGLLKEPTLGELKDERNRLEKEVFQTSNSTNIEPVAVNNIQRQVSDIDRSRRSSTSSTSSSLQSPRSTIEMSTALPKRSNGPLRAFAGEPSTPIKPSLSIDRKVSVNSTMNQSPVLLRLGSIKQDELLKKYPPLKTNNDRPSNPVNSAEKFRRMVLDCREMSS